MPHLNSDEHQFYLKHFHSTMFCGHFHNLSRPPHLYSFFGSTSNIAIKTKWKIIINLQGGKHLRECCFCRILTLSGKTVTSEYKRKAVSTIFLFFFFSCFLSLLCLILFAVVCERAQDVPPLAKTDIYNGNCRRLVCAARGLLLPTTSLDQPSPTPLV